MYVTAIQLLINTANVCVDYLEKAGSGSLGSMTASGKIVNAGMNNRTLYAVWYQKLTGTNLQGEPYCAMGVSSMYGLCFGKELGKKLLCGGYYHYCPTGYNRFKEKGRIYNTPAVGDVVFYWSSSLGRWGHTGMVIEVNGNRYKTVEMNTSSASQVIRNGGATRIKTYTVGAQKEAFGRPDWSLVTEDVLNDNTLWIQRLQMAIGTDVDGIFGKDSLSKLPTLKKGSSNKEAIRIVQEKLTRYGFDTNGLDGIFGSGMAKAVSDFQTQVVGITGDGQIDAGYSTWTTLINYTGKVEAPAPVEPPKPEEPTMPTPFGWEDLGNGDWKYYNGGPNSEVRNDWIDYKGDWYYFKDDGYMVRGCRFVAANGKPYSFDETGKMEYTNSLGELNPENDKYY